MKEVLKYLQAGAIVPVDMKTTTLLVNALREALAQPAQESAAWATKEDFYRELDRRVERMRKEMEIKTVTMRCKDYDVALNIVDMYGGHVVVGQVSFPPQRQWVGLTDDAEIFAISNTMPYADRFEFARAIEAVLKEKNDAA